MYSLVICLSSLEYKLLRPEPLFHPLIFVFLEARIISNTWLMLKKYLLTVVWMNRWIGKKTGSFGQVGNIYCSQSLLKNNMQSHACFCSCWSLCLWCPESLKKDLPLNTRWQFPLLSGAAPNLKRQSQSCSALGFKCILNIPLWNLLN